VFHLCVNSWFERFVQTEVSFAMENSLKIRKRHKATQTFKWQKSRKGNSV